MKEVYDITDLLINPDKPLTKEQYKNFHHFMAPVSIEERLGVGPCEYPSPIATKKRVNRFLAKKNHAETTKEREPQ